MAITQPAQDVLTKLTYLEWQDHYETEQPTLVFEELDETVDNRKGKISVKEGEEEVN
jgi:hypothetical protein